MGTEICLEIAGVDVVCSKNSMGIDHGSLFQSKDRKRIANPDHDDVDGFDADFEMGFHRSLGSTKTRLDLLGYTMSTVRRHYERAAAECREERESMREYGVEFAQSTEFMSFEELLTFVAENPIGDLSNAFSFDLGAPRSKVIGRFHNDKRMVLLPFFDEHDTGYSERGHFIGSLGFLHPYSILRLLAECPENCLQDLIWLYGPLVVNGWAQITDFIPEARRTEKYLIATEGTSDIYILKRAIDILHPELSDFFRFIDASDRHPFSGAGNLVKFAEGLAKIDVHNKVLFLLDNDAEGRQAHNSILEMQLPSNMRAMTLPNHLSFERINTLGPAGEAISDINGKAVAIECFLDFEQRELPPPQVRWTTYKEKLGIYQGELMEKARYAKVFQKSDKINYDYSKLELLLESIIFECCQIAVP
ncbi:hypothetical protein JMM61_17580 [Rhodovulum sulfidophilum]|uniref:HEPN/Toprim-associated domain-containing protein n=1 Tax=Rhodovulum sulfidophilum TaxID=35806 RepID=UPI001927FFB3|nr:HEPN/Toprim-associated domain-containing protein [Rhodovulum sulfidophilum]MBL3587170.1 hypothetical protein [Rhodovulum sulfidophilum]